MTRTGRRRRRGGGNGVLVPAVIILSMVAIVTVLIWYFYVHRDPTINRQTNCPTEMGTVKRSIFFLLDTTRQLSATQQALIKNTFYDVVRAAQGHDRIFIFEVDPSEKRLLKPLFAHCKPAKSDFGSPILQRFEEMEFKRQLQEYFDNVSFERPTSPIIGALGSVATSFPNDGSSHHLIIASDFVENSALMNQRKPDWRKKFEAKPGPVYAKQPRLEGIKVGVLFIPRADLEHHDHAFRDWWLKYLRDSGADLTEQNFHNPVTGHRFDLDPFIPITG